MSSWLIEAYRDAAALLAAKAELQKVVPCDATQGEQACAKRFSEDFSRRALRRATREAERNALLAVYEAGRTDASFERGVRSVIEAVLQSPSFLYQGANFTKFALDVSRRRGLLTHPALLSVLSKPNQSDPVIRGKFVRERLLCQPLPPPSPNVATVPPDPQAGLTTGQRFSEHASNASCTGCHELMDPIGFGLENFDALGRYRSSDEGVAVDVRGEIVSSADADGAFDGALALAARLADSRAVRECVATQYFGFAIAHRERCRRLLARLDLRALRGAGRDARLEAQRFGAACQRDCVTVDRTFPMDLLRSLAYFAAPETRSCNNSSTPSSTPLSAQR